MWIDPWIKYILTFKPTTPVIDGLEDLRVSHCVSMVYHHGILVW